MKLSLNWIKDYVPLPDDIEITRMMHDLTMSTVEVEGAEVIADRFKNIVVGRVEEILPHPNADNLCVCRVDTGEGELKEIVCGGVNLTTGMKAAVAKPGAMVRWHGEGDLVEIKNAKVRGVTSYGMICASSEIGLGDLLPAPERVIADISAFDATPGTCLAKALGIDDVILEIDNKSLTNRPDLWGHYGIARELSAIYDLPLAPLPHFSLPETDGGLRVDVLDASRCPRCTATKIENVSSKAASFEMQARLWLVGQRPLGAIVDITNYVMLAIGQPTHAYDRNNIAGEQIVVRRAKPGEKLLLLNGKDLTLEREDLVISDADKAIGLAGIMGGSTDSILHSTKDVILEIANFTPLGTRKTAQRYELRSEASSRYEKGIDPQRIDGALALALRLFEREFPGMRVTGYVDRYPAPLEPSRVTASLDWLARRMGKRLDDTVIRALLERLGFTVEIADDELRVLAPSWRSTGDISLPDDIMEEIARLHGYENFEARPITTTFERAINQRDKDLERRIKEYLSARCGMQEIFTYPWMQDEFIDALGIDRDETLKLATPPSPHEACIRSTLLPNLVRAVSENLRYFDEFSIYELTQVFFGRDYSTPYDERERLPGRRRHLAGAFAGPAGAVSDLFRRAKGAVEWMPRFTHMEALSFEQLAKSPWADDTVWLDICLEGEPIGQLALLSKKSALAAGIKQAGVVLFELDVERLTPLPSRTNVYKPLPEYPQVEFDISMIFDETVKWSDIEQTARGKGGPDFLVRSVSFVDEYRGKQVAAGKKSITLRVLFASDKKTLTSEEIERAAGTIAKRLGKQLGGEMRGTLGL